MVAEVAVVAVVSMMVNGDDKNEDDTHYHHSVTGDVMRYGVNGAVVSNPFTHITCCSTYCKYGIYIAFSSLLRAIGQGYIYVGLEVWSCRDLTERPPYVNMMKLESQ